MHCILWRHKHNNPWLACLSCIGHIMSSLSTQENVFSSLFILQSGEKCPILSEVAALDQPGAIRLLHDIIPVIGCCSRCALRHECDRYLYSAIGKLRGTSNCERVLNGVGKATGELCLGLWITQPEVVCALIIPVIDVGVIRLHSGLSLLNRRWSIGGSSGRNCRCCGRGSSSGTGGSGSGCWCDIRVAKQPRWFYEK